MSVALVGQPLAVLVSREFTFDPKYGYAWQLTYKGAGGPIEGAAYGFNVIGLRTTVTQNEAVWTLVVVYPTDPGGAAEIPLDVWNLSTEFAQIDIWSNPLLISKLCGAFTAGSPSAAQALMELAEDDVADLKDVIKDLLKKNSHGGPVAPSESELELVDLEIYKLILRGTEAYEQKRPILSRRRTISITYAAPLIIDEVEKFYSTAALIALFAVPARVASKLPANPTTKPSSTQWGWRLRKQESTLVPRINKDEEVTDWIFAAWSTLLYQYITVP